MKQELNKYYMTNGINKNLQNTQDKSKVSSTKVMRSNSILEDSSIVFNKTNPEDIQKLDKNMFANNDKVL